MDAISRIEQLLAFSTQALGDVAQELRHAPELEKEKFLKVVGLALYNLSELRSSIYESKPELKPQHRQMADDDLPTYQKLTTLLESAWDFEVTNNLRDAKIAYEEILKETQVEYFVLLAQVGLFRSSGGVR
jgi:hypothetical protein